MSAPCRLNSQSLSKAFTLCPFSFVGMILISTMIVLFALPVSSFKPFPSLSINKSSFVTPLRSTPNAKFNAFKNVVFPALFAPTNSVSEDNDISKSFSERKFFALTFSTQTGIIYFLSCNIQIIFYPKAFFKSSIKSSTFSIPTLNLINESVKPTFNLSSLGIDA
jgi:hypothetical protein